MQKVSITLVSDLSGEEIAEGKGETVTFGLDSSTYEIDLATSEAKELRKALDKFVTNGRKVSGSRGTARRSASKSDYDAKQVRQWATDNGLDVPARGRIPATIVEQWKTAH